MFKPAIPSDNTKQRKILLDKLYPELKEMIPSPVLSGSNIYSLKPPSEKEKEFKVDDFSVTIKQVKTLNFKENPKSLLHFFNNALRNLFNRLNYAEIGRTGKFFYCKDAKTSIKT